MEHRDRPPVDFSVVICTRNRPGQVRQVLDALDAQDHRRFDVLVVDQSDQVDEELERREAGNAHLRVVRDPGRGLSRARNLAWRQTPTEWLVYVDDDCLPEPDWAARLVEVFAAHPEAAYVSGEVIGHNRAPEAQGLQYSVFPVARPEIVAGRWVWPWRIGFGVCHAVRRSMVARLDGWDERFGPGVAAFPASDDMDFNYRLLRAGGIAYITPAVRSRHDQWRRQDDVVRLFGGYMASWAGFAVKTFRSGDPLGGTRLWLYGLQDTARMVASAAKHRSRFRLGVAASKARGLIRGTAAGLRQDW